MPTSLLPSALARLGLPEAPPSSCLLMWPHRALLVHSEGTNHLIYRSPHVFQTGSNYVTLLWVLVRTRYLPYPARHSLPDQGLAFQVQHSPSRRPQPAPGMGSVCAFHRWHSAHGAVRALRPSHASLLGRRWLRGSVQSNTMIHALQLPSNLLVIPVTQYPQ